MTDQFYTPLTIAHQMIAYVSNDQQSLIADFSAGDGRLLMVAQQRWPEACILATDINAKSNHFLRQNNSLWRIGECDFTEADSRYNCQVLQESYGSVTLALLNPPFSTRGNKYWLVKVGDDIVRCSIALAFLLNALPYLKLGGEMVAILPEGCLYNRSDEEARKTLERCTIFEVVGHNGNHAFENCTPRTVTVRLTKLHVPLQSVVSHSHLKEIISLDKKPVNAKISVEIVRGKLRMDKVTSASSKQLPLVHTTELLENGIDLNRRSVDLIKETMVGPVVLLPRVGRPDSTKVHLYVSNKQIVLSDCIIALRCDNQEDAEVVYFLMKKCWLDVMDAYRGTCALHLTMGRLKCVLESLGLIANIRSKRYESTSISLT